MVYRAKSLRGNEGLADPLVSVVLATYQQQSYVRKSIESVLNQSLGDLELIVVDDGSPDDTLKIAQSVHDPRIKILSQPNQGPSVAFNRGMEIAKGKYLAIMSGDDICFPDRLKTQVKVYEEKKPCGLFSFVTFIDDHESEISPPDFLAGLFN